MNFQIGGSHRIGPFSCPTEPQTGHQAKTRTTRSRACGPLYRRRLHLWIAYRNALQRAFINGNQEMIVSRTTDNSTSAANYLNDDSLRDHAEMWKVGGKLSTMWHPYIHDGEPRQAEAMRTIARAGVITVYTRRGVGLRGPNHERKFRYSNFLIVAANVVKLMADYVITASGNSNLLRPSVLCLGNRGATT